MKKLILLLMIFGISININAESDEQENKKNISTEIKDYMKIVLKSFRIGAGGGNHLLFDKKLGEKGDENTGHFLSTLFNTTDADASNNARNFIDMVYSVERSYLPSSIRVTGAFNLFEIDFSKFGFNGFELDAHLHCHWRAGMKETHEYNKDGFSKLINMISLQSEKVLEPDLFGGLAFNFIKNKWKFGLIIGKTTAQLNYQIKAKHHESLIKNLESNVESNVENIEANIEAMKKTHNESHISNPQSSHKALTFGPMVEYAYSNKISIIGFVTFYGIKTEREDRDAHEAGKKYKISPSLKVAEVHIGFVYKPMPKKS